MIQNNLEFVDKLKVALDKPTLYVMGGIGWRLNTAGKNRAYQCHSYNKKPERKKMIEVATEHTWAFDCNNFIKSVLWGWVADETKNYGGATYNSNGVADLSPEGLISFCQNVTNDFSNLEIGELLYMKSHVGIYIGKDTNGVALCIECSPAWKNGVQITAIQNCGATTGYNARTWLKHGILPYFKYITETPTNNVPVTPSVTKVDTSKYPIVKKGSTGKYVTELQKRLVELGYDPKGIDGIFGNGCLAAVKSFQKTHTDSTGKKLVVDGCVGPKTWDALYR